MSEPKAFERINWALDQEVGNPTRKLILVHLSILAASKGYCWVKQSTLAANAECKRQTVNEHIGALVDEGFIAKRPQHRADGMRRDNEYLLLYHADVKWPDGTSPLMSGNRTSRCQPTQTSSVSPRRQVMSGGPDSNNRTENRTERTEQDSTAQATLERYVKGLDEVEILKDEWQEADIAKPGWKDAFAGLVDECGEETVSDGVERLLGFVKDERAWHNPSGRKWRTLLSRKNSAERFVQYFDDVLTISPVEDIPDNQLRFGRQR
jgi:Helix-turn-helix domain